MSTRKGLITKEMFDQYKIEQQLLVGKLNKKVEMQNKKNKKIIFFVMAFSLIFSGIASVFSYSFGANNVAYTPIDSNWKVYNTQEAIDNLFESVGASLVGAIYSYMGISAPAGYLACDGSTYLINDFPRLANHIKANFGSTNYFGGDGETTFAVPDLRGEFLRGTGTSTYTNQGSGNDVGTHTDEGLPNITGYFGGEITHWNGTTWPNGAFSSYSQRTTTDHGHSNYSATWIAPSFNASLSNAIYGKSSHVTPTNTSVLYIIKY